MKWQAGDEFERDDEDDERDASDDRHDPDESDMDPSDEEDDEETVRCPYCNKPIHEDAQVCRHCQSFVSFEDAPPRQSHAWWYWAAAILGLIGIGGWTIWMAIRMTMSR